MRLLRNIAGDLVEKRLWPVAVGLVVLLVALPAIVAGRAVEPPLLPSAPAPAAGPSATAAVQSAGPPRPRNRPGKLRNPFADAPPVPRVDRAVAPVDDGAGDERQRSDERQPGAELPAAPTVVPAAPGSGSRSGSPPLEKAPAPKAAPRPATGHSATLRFGEPGKVETLTDLPKLSPLPSEADPVLVHLGVEDDGETATFLLPSEVTPTGDGACTPSPKDCQRLALGAGETVFLDVDLGDAGVRQFQLEVVRIKAGAARPDGKAAKARSAAAARRPGFDVGLRAGDATMPRAPRLTLLPDALDPALVLLGVGADERSALFANVYGARVSGEGTCRPSPERCGVVEVPVGTSATIARPGGGPYRVAVGSVTAARARESAVGRAFLRAGLQAGILGVDGLVHDGRTGTLRRR